LSFLVIRQIDKVPPSRTVFRAEGTRFRHRWRLGFGPRMTRVARYVLIDLLQVFLVALAAMTVLMLLVGLAQEAIRQGLGPLPLLRLIPYVLPNALRFTVPGTMLFAVCCVYGRMAAANEIVAIKSLGISPWRVAMPSLVFAFLISLLTVWLNDLAVSWGRLGMQRVLLASIEEVAYGMLRTHRAYHSGSFSINVKRVENRKLIRPTICFDSPEHDGQVIVTAMEAELLLRPEHGLLSVLLTDGEISAAGGVSMRFPDTIERDIPLSVLNRHGDRTDNPSAMPMGLLTREAIKQRRAVEQLQAQSALVEAAEGNTAAGDIRAQLLSDARYRLHRLEAEPWRRWATGFSCLFFVLVGTPLAIRLRTADIWTTFAMCFLPILLVYYPLLAVGVDQSKTGALPPYAVWLGNLVLGLASLPLWRQAIRR
jgi:lipopolysaccharide export system permease protein